jgi:hypothetical protein
MLRVETAKADAEFRRNRTLLSIICGDSVGVPEGLPQKGDAARQSQPNFGLIRAPSVKPCGRDDPACRRKREPCARITLS